MRRPRTVTITASRGISVPPTAPIRRKMIRRLASRPGQHQPTPLSSTGG